MARTRAACKLIAELGPLAPYIEGFADLVAERVHALGGQCADDDLVDRKSCPYSKRWWDANVGRTFEARKDGRRLVARRGEVDAAFARLAKFAPKSKTEPTPEPTDPDEAELVAAGIKLNGGCNDRP
jgi:hypothetical protein